MSDDPLDRIEAAHGFEDLGRMAVLALRGAMEESRDDPGLAAIAVMLLFQGMFSAKAAEKEEKEEEEGGSS